MYILRLELISGDVSKFFNYRKAYYVIGNINVTFYLSDKFSAIDNVINKGYNALTVSFSSKAHPISHEIINYCLSYFGFDTTKEYYVNTGTHRDYTDNSLYKTIYYEQLTKRKV